MAHSRTDAFANRRTPTGARLAIDGGQPVRQNWLPYGHQSITDSDIDAVVRVLKTDWLTQGPTIAEFEESIAEAAGSKYAVAYSNGTAALHGAYFACGISDGDEIVTSALTFAATANAALYLGAIPRFADIIYSTGNIDPASVERLITSKSKAIVAVDYAGQPCRLDELRAIADKHHLLLIEDAAHALGAEYKGRKVGSISDLSTFSFHPVKTITTGEGGAVTTNDPELARRLRNFRTHGIEKNDSFLSQASPGPWYYEVQDLGFNYRMTDIQAALGLSQMARLQEFLARRRQIAARYREAFAQIEGMLSLVESADVKSANHLFPVLLADGEPTSVREKVVRALHAENIGVQVHYIPVYQHPLYKRVLKEDPGKDCPVTERFYECVFSLPMFPAMTEQDIDDVITAVFKVLPACLTQRKQAGKAAVE